VLFRSFTVLIALLAGASFAASFLESPRYAVQVTVLAVGLFAIAVAAALEQRIAERIAAPVRALQEQSRRIAELDLGPAAPVATSLAEMRELADSLENMRGSLELYFTEHQRRQHAQELLEKQNLTLFEQSPFGQFIVNEDGVLLAANPALADVVGRGVDEIRGLSLFDFTTQLGAAEREKQLEALHQLEQKATLEWELARADGSVASIRMWGTSLARGQERYTYGVVEDTSERLRERRTWSKERERLTSRVSEQEEELRTLRAKVAASTVPPHGYVSQEAARQLNAPIGSILLAAQLALETQDAAATRDLLSDIVKNARRCARLVQTSVGVPDAVPPAS
jgi:PAS domain S-box-containing protein